MNISSFPRFCRSAQVAVLISLAVLAVLYLLMLLPTVLPSVGWTN